MYLYPIFLEKKIDFKNLKDLEILNIVSEHMNKAAINSIEYLIDIYENIKNSNGNEKANKYINTFFPEQLKGKQKSIVLKEILDELNSPVLRDVREEYVYIIYKALMNFYTGIDEYSLEFPLVNEEQSNIFRIEDKEKRNMVINYFKTNINNLKDIFSEIDEELIVEYLMRNIEDVNSYKDILLELVGNDDFLYFFPISF